MSQLELALEKEFSNFKHIETDTDMNNIRNAAEFIELLKKFNPKLNSNKIIKLKTSHI